MHVVYAVLVVLTAAAHFTFVAYMVLGGFLAVRWPRTIWVHIPVVIWGIAIELINFVCPLTGLERWARPKAGMAPLDPDGFIDHYLTGVAYPDRRQSRSRRGLVDGSHIVGTGFPSTPRSRSARRRLRRSTQKTRQRWRSSSETLTRSITY